MARDEHATAPQAGNICHVCHHSVSAVLTRHKTMGVFVPRWEPGPCRNPDCPNCPEHTRREQRPVADGTKS